MNFKPLFHLDRAGSSARGGTILGRATRAHWSPPRRRGAPGERGLCRDAPAVQNNIYTNKKEESVCNAKNIDFY